MRRPHFRMTSVPTSEPHSKALRANRSLQEGATFFVTKCLFPRKPLLTTTRVADEIVATLRFSVKEKRILLAAFVVMPDHWHALFSAIPPLRPCTAQDLPFILLPSVFYDASTRRF